ncbi:MAG: SDR family NAD(P)-dependent oxidoreductase [Rhodospirillaceae bacterium]|nr:SDR family NAD(P)-dependent oxidoreductase [Rhodospirillaceae bacterium]MBT3884615.1 SDR family NAD(P)-dependent oxidoreductase [Rhodospirillaceae bacterium]MBT4750708.1 SDR family NAD(P)-dependent oxidoreductase [Rhodospirillaceae bacterium]MBT6858174.1 SDR family NAD(P)-dependent oxidoreductase [Rhodospirillaceae bacterium]
MSKSVLVTGASGHVGGALVRELVENGYHVRASVRDPMDAAKTDALKKLQAEVVKADLFDPASLDAACTGMDGVFQVAAIYDLAPSDAVQARIMTETGTLGMANVLNAAKKAGVGRIVLTSSVVTIAPVAPGQPAASEDSWVSDTSVTYIEEKSSGEKHAWQLSGELGLDMVSVLPGAVTGPGFNRSTPSVDFIEAFAKGSLRMGAPDIGFPFVDVRDVATAHSLAYEKGEIGQRYIAMNQTVSLYDMGVALSRIDPNIAKPLMKMPGFMTGMVPYIDAIMAKLSGYPHSYTKALHDSWKGREWRIDDSASRRALGYAPAIDLAQSLADTVEQLRANGRL